MSLSGKLLRGLKWHNFRNLKGEYHKDISSSHHKMEEVKFYLDFIKIRDEKKVHKILEKIMILDLSNQPRFMQEEAEKLDGDLYNEEYKKELAKIAAAKKKAEEEAKKKAEEEAKKKAEVKDGRKRS